MIDAQINHGLSAAEGKAADTAGAAIVSALGGLGYSATLSYDFTALVVLNELRRDRQYPALVPWYDPRIEPCGWPDAFWISFSDEHARVVGAVACRLRVVVGSLRERLADMTFLFPDAEQRGAWGRVTSPDLYQIAGNIMLPGAMWVDPDHRRKGLATRLFALAMIQGYAKWKPDYVIGLVEEPKENDIGFDSYQFPRSHKKFVPHVPSFAFTANDEPLAVMSMTQREMRARFLLGENP